MTISGNTLEGNGGIVESTGRPGDLHVSMALPLASSALPQSASSLFRSPFTEMKFLDLVGLLRLLGSTVYH